MSQFTCEKRKLASFANPMKTKYVTKQIYKKLKNRKDTFLEGITAMV